MGYNNKRYYFTILITKEQLKYSNVFLPANNVFPYSCFPSHSPFAGTPIFA